MPIQVEYKDTAGDAPGENQPATGGPLAELQAIYDAIDTGRNQTATFDVPGTNIVVRYRRLSSEDSAAALTSEGEQWERNAQFLIAACDEILYRNPQGDLEPVQPGVTATFDFRPGESEALHKILGRDMTARESVLHIFQGAERVLLLHAEAVDAWMDRLQGETEDEFSGG